MSLVTFPRQFLVDLNGKPRVGAKAYFYQAGTSTPIVVYTTPAVNVPLTNPVLSLANGFFPAIYVNHQVNQTYKLVITDSSDVPVSSEDNIPAFPFTQSDLAFTLYAQTDSEQTAGVTPSSYLYPEGTLERYGLLGDGSTDDAAAFEDAIAVGAQGVNLVGTPGKTYVFFSAVVPGSYFDLDLRGATIKFSGDTFGFNSLLTPTATVAVSGGIAQGARTCAVVSATGLAVGQWSYVTCNDAPTNPAASFPPSWARITNIVGTTITFDRTFPVAYPSGAATLDLSGVNDTTMQQLCRIRNGKIDGSANLYSGAALGRAMRIVGYKVVDIDVELVGWNTSSTNGDLAVAVHCHTVNWKLTAIGNVTASQHSNTFDCMSVKYIGCSIDGDGFGISMTRCDSAIATGNSLVGRRKKNSDDSVSPVQSVRGIKAYGCKHAVITSNEISDYESAIKVEAYHRAVVANNIVTNCSLEASYTGAIAINVGQATDGNFSGGVIVNGNIVENCGGIGIGITATLAVGRNIVNGNIVRTVQGVAIYTVCRNTIITNNQIADWGLRNSSDAGIHIDAGATVTGNRFYHATLTSLPCIRNEIDAGFLYVVRDNAPEDGNPLGLVMENSGSVSIASGATSSVVTHGLSRTPQSTEIVLTVGGTSTNDPGILHVSAITSTQFTINCRADPGASGLSVAWRVTHPLLA